MGLVYSRVTEGVAFVGKAGVDAVVTFWMFSLGCFPWDVFLSRAGSPQSLRGSCCTHHELIAWSLD